MLIIAIVASVVAVMLDSMAGVRARWGPSLRAFEWAITVAFTAEYLLRLLSARGAWRYARSFFGLIDLSRGSFLAQTGQPGGYL